jgi:hypothetical protein
MDKLHLVYVPSHAREQVRYKLSALPIRFESPWGFHHTVTATELSRVSEFSSIVERKHLPVPLFKHRLVIKGIDLANPSLHKQEYNPLRFGTMMKPIEPLNAIRTCCTKAIASHHGLSRKRSESTACPTI